MDWATHTTSSGGGGGGGLDFDERETAYPNSIIAGVICRGYILYVWLLEGSAAL